MTNYALQNNYPNICRACLVENSNMKSIFSIEEIMEQKIMLCDMLMSCASILIVQGDGLPENVCVNCFQQANSAYLFRKLCERSDVTLRACSAFTSLTGNQSNIFTSVIDEDKFEFSINNSINVEKENQNEEEILINESHYDTQLDDGSINDDQNSSENEPENENICLPSNKRNYSCKKCNEFCVGLASFRAHMANVHGDIFRCEHCGKQFNAKNFLARHINSRHIKTAEPKRRNKTGIIKKRNLPRTCDICNKTFRFHSNLERHKLIHTGEKPYLCNVCGKGFAQMAYLKIHSFIHTVPMDQAAAAISPPRKRKSKHFSVEDKERILNIYKVCVQDNPDNRKRQNVEFTAKASGVSVTSVFNILREYKGTHELHSPTVYHRQRAILDNIDDGTKSALRCMIHSFFKRNEPPTLNKMLAAVHEDELLSQFKRSTLRTLIKEIGFRFSKRSRDSVLRKKDEIIARRRRFLGEIKKYREEGKKLYFLDETWLNAGHTVTKVWKDTTILTPRQAFIEGLTTGLKDPSGEKPYKCQMCERSFAAPGTLMTHVRTHTGERPHICKICGKDFPQSGYLSAHIRTHTGEKPVECKVCNRRFNQSGRLIVHMRIHSGEKPYQCKECGRSFAVKGTLKKHMRTHTGERPYTCKVCGQAFAQSGTLSTHMKVHKHKGDLTSQ